MYLSKGASSPRYHTSDTLAWEAGIDQSHCLGTEHLRERRLAVG